MPEPTTPIKSKKRVWWLIVILVVLLVLVGLIYRRQGKFASNWRRSYQAVFLVNGQVYFGRLSHLYSQFPLLTDVYYVQAAPTGASGQLQLVKRGDEPHGPTGAMRLSREQILFIENLKPTSQIVKLISGYQAKPAK